MTGWRVSGLAAVVGLALLPGSASAGVASQTFAYTGTEQSFTVPSDVNAVSVVGAGAAGVKVGAPGGAGDQVTGTVAVTPGSKLYVEVAAAGCNGGAPGGSGAGAGGGATDVRTVSIGATALCGGAQSPNSIASRLLVAAGGGGGGVAGLLTPAGAGGAAGQPGVGGGAAGTTLAGGAGGGGGSPGTLWSGGPGANAGFLTGPGGGGGGGLYGGGGGGTSGGGGGGSDLVPSGGSSGSTSAAPSVTITYQTAASKLTLSLSATQLSANGTDTTTATVTEVDEDGIAVRQNPPAITTTDSGVGVGPATEVGDSGTYTAILIASTHAGQVTVTAADPVSGANAQATFAQVAGPAANIGVRVSPQAIRADGSSSANVVATVTDAFGNPKAGESVSLASSDSAQQLSAVTDQGNGTYTSTVTSSTQIHAVTITASDGSLRATTTLSQTGFPVSIAVALTPTEVVADGKSTATVTATVRDGSSIAIGGEHVTFTTSDKAVDVGRVTDHGDGTYSATIRSSTTAHLVTVTAHDGGLSGTATLTETATAPHHGSTPVFKGALAAGRNGALVVLQCVSGADGSPCAGAVSLTFARHHKTVTVGQATFSMRPGRSVTVVVPLSKRGRSLLRRHHGRLTLALRVGGTQVRTVRLIALSTAR